MKAFEDEFGIPQMVDPDDPDSLMDEHAMIQCDPNHSSLAERAKEAAAVRATVTQCRREEAATVAMKMKRRGPDRRAARDLH